MAKGKGHFWWFSQLSAFAFRPLPHLVQAAAAFARRIPDRRRGRVGAHAADATISTGTGNDDHDDDDYGDDVAASSGAERPWTAAELTIGLHVRSGDRSKNHVTPALADLKVRPPHCPPPPPTALPPRTTQPSLPPTSAVEGRAVGLVNTALDLCDCSSAAGRALE